MESIKNYLEIVIITYNRSSLLQKTLDALYESPFLICHITVLNNSSTDNTLEICDAYLNKFPNINIITNNINIGGNANILRAIEISNGKYTWVLADDDEYDFSDCDDFLEAIFEKKAELIHVGAHTNVPWNFGGSLDIPRNLCKRGYPFFRFSSFIPCNVFKTESFYPYTIHGYNNIINSYPHMPFLMSFFEYDKRIYIVKSRIVKAVMGLQEYSSRDIWEWWLNTSSLLNNVKDRLSMFKEQFIISDNKLNSFFFPARSFLLMIRYDISIFKLYLSFGKVFFLFSVFSLPLYCFFLMMKKIFSKYKFVIK